MNEKAVNVAAYCIRDQNFVFVFDDCSLNATLRRVDRYVQQKKLTLHEARKMSYHFRRMVTKG